MGGETGFALHRIRLLSTVSICLSAAIGSAAGLAILNDHELLPSWIKHPYEWLFVSSEELADRARSLRMAGDSAGAVRLFQEALRKDQSSAYRWCDYGEALLAAGNESKARRCMERAVQLGSHVGPIRMRAVNFAYLNGDASWALNQGLALVGMTEQYDEAVFGIWERMGIGPATVLRAGLPNRRSAQAYFRRFLTPERLAEAEIACDWAERRGFLDDQLADQYAGLLVASGEREKAVRAWAEHTRALEPLYPERNLVFNGGFEHESFGSVFDWSIYPVEGVRVRRDPGVSVAGKWSLRLDFDHTSNLEYQAVSERTVVPPGRWTFEGSIRTDDITTDEGIGFRVFDADSPSRLLKHTARLTGTHGWTPLKIEFAVSASTRLIVIQVVRSQSQKFDNLLGGTAWVDAVSLRPAR